MIWRDDKILLGERLGSHGGSTWGWCGGHLEIGETLEACAVRETLEESGIALEPHTLHPLCMHNVMAYGQHYVDVEFWTDVATGEPQIMEISKTRRWCWFTLDGLPAPLFEPVQMAIASWRDGRWYHPPVTS